LPPGFIKERFYIITSASNFVNIIFDIPNLYDYNAIYLAGFSGGDQMKKFLNAFMVVFGPVLILGSIFSLAYLNHIEHCIEPALVPKLVILCVFLLNMGCLMLVVGMVRSLNMMKVQEKKVEERIS